MNQIEAEKMYAEMWKKTLDPKPMKIDRKHIHLFETLSRNSYIDTPANLEFTDGSPLTDKDFRVIVTLRSALTLFQSMGIVPTDVTLDLREPFQS